MTARYKRMGGLAIAAAAMLIGFGLAQLSGPEPVAAEQEPAGKQNAAAPATESNKRVVAYLFGNVPITREEFGDYFINLYGKERLPLYVNQRIIEMEAAKKGITVTPIEIDAAIAEDCKRINIDKADFLRTVLRQRYGKSIEEWRTDVMRPRLLLAKLCRNQITVDEKELKQMFENRYGEKARVKIILWPASERNVAHKLYGELRKPGTENNPDAGWDAVATKQPDANLAARAGEILPIGRYSGPESARVEEIAFNLKDGDISPIIELKIGFLVVKRIGTVPPEKGVDFEKVKPELYKEVVERKLEKEIPSIFAKMKETAKPILLLGDPQLPEPDPALIMQQRQE